MRDKQTRQCYADMKQRCLNQNHQQYKNYGARGIVICERWLASFESFLIDMGRKPEGKTLDRIDNEGPYSPENCRWATPAEQRTNQRSCVFLEYDGKRMTIEEWGREIGRHPTTLRSRLKAGWPVDAILSPDRLLRGRFSEPHSWAAMKEQP